MKNSPLKIDIVCNDGSPLHTCFLDIYGENGRIGLGGAELALHTMCEEWHKAGHRVRLYNNPITPKGSPYEQCPIDLFIPHESRDILIIFRSPNERVKNAKGKKIWWSTDQYTVGNFQEFASQVDEIVTISSHHAEHFKNVYGIENTTTIPLPVRVSDYGEDIEKIKNRMIFCSVPDRGLDLLARAYPLIKDKIPDVSLIITSDYRLWGVGEPRNERFIQQFLGMDGVKFLGAVPRRELIAEQMKAQVMAYPCTYNELFCYAVAECQVAGAFPVTSSVGALSTTSHGLKLDGNPHDRGWVNRYADAVIETLQSPHLTEFQNEVKEYALFYFSPPVVLERWDKLFYE